MLSESVHVHNVTPVSPSPCRCTAFSHVHPPLYTLFFLSTLYFSPCSCTSLQFSPCSSTSLQSIFPCSSVSLQFIISPVRAPPYNLFSHVRPPLYDLFPRCSCTSLQFPRCSSASLQSISPCSSASLQSFFPLFVHLLRLSSGWNSNSDGKAKLRTSIILCSQWRVWSERIAKPVEHTITNMHSSTATAARLMGCIKSNCGWQSSLRSCLRQAKRARAAWQTLGHRAVKLKVWRSNSERQNYYSFCLFGLNVFSMSQFSLSLSLSHTHTRARARA